MVDSTCVLPPPNPHAPPLFAMGAANGHEGNPLLALGQSVSFGRYVSQETLSWEKWSAFSSTRYVEEARKFSRPGSVAEKRAFFEAYFKQLAEKKSLALLDDENDASSTVSESEGEGEDRKQSTDQDMVEAIWDPQTTDNPDQVCDLANETQKAENKGNTRLHLMDESQVMPPNAGAGYLDKPGTDTSMVTSSVPVHDEEFKSKTLSYSVAPPQPGKRMQEDISANEMKACRKRRSLAARFLQACKHALWLPKSCCTPIRSKTKGKAAGVDKKKFTKEPRKKHRICCFGGNIPEGKEAKKKFTKEPRKKRGSCCFGGNIPEGKEAENKFTKQPRKKSGSCCFGGNIPEGKEAEKKFKKRPGKWRRISCFGGNIHEGKEPEGHNQKRNVVISCPKPTKRGSKLAVMKPEPGHR